VAPTAILIGAADLLPALRERVQAGADALIFADTEPLKALQAITTHRPPLVVLERLFAATPRGAALINRLRADPSLAGLEVRVVSHTGDYVRTIARPASPAGQTIPSAAPAPAATDAPPRPLDWHGTRRAPRVRLKPGVEIQIDGNPARVVDLSVIGAQALSPKSLRPDQKVRVTIVNERETVRFRATVAWARFELAKPPASPYYRVGLEFVDADPVFLEAFCRENRA
jgi:hypothetical protein